MKPDRFVAKIAQREGVTPLDAVVHARAVFITLREAIGDDEFFDITSQLDPDYDALWLRR
jgi:uncharacterized protein (DUF2267 family)